MTRTPLSERRLTCPNISHPASSSRKSSAARGRSRACRPAPPPSSARPNAADAAAAGHQLQRIPALFRRRVRRPASSCPMRVSGFFENGGRRAYVCRIVGAGATPRRATVGGLRSRRSGPGAWGNRVFVKIRQHDTTGRAVRRLPAAGRLLETPLRRSYPRSLRPTQPRHCRADADRGFRRSRLGRSEFARLLRQAAADGNSALVRRSSRSATALGRARRPPIRGRSPAAPTAPALAGSTTSRATTTDSNERTGLVGARARRLSRRRAGRRARGRRRHVAQGGLEPLRAQPVPLRRHRSRPRARRRRHGSIRATDLRTPTTRAFYYPWICVADPQTGAEQARAAGRPRARRLRPHRHRARRLQGAGQRDRCAASLDLEFDINDGTQDVLNPRASTPSARFPGRGIRVWGARTLSSNALWKYVSVRRLFIFLERSIYEGTQWVVFEPNDDRLWARVKRHDPPVPAHAVALRRAVRARPRRRRSSSPATARR